MDSHSHSNPIPENEPIHNIWQVKKPVTLQTCIVNLNFFFCQISNRFQTTTTRKDHCYRNFSCTLQQYKTHRTHLWRIVALRRPSGRLIIRFVHQYISKNKQNEERCSSPISDRHLEDCNGQFQRNCDHAAQYEEGEKAFYIKRIIFGHTVHCTIPGVVQSFSFRTISVLV